MIVFILQHRKNEKRIYSYRDYACYFDNRHLSFCRFTEALRSGTTASELFRASLNDITLTGAQFARQLGKVQKIFIDISGKKIELMDLDSDKSKRSANIPAEMSIEDVLIDGATVFTGGGSKLTAYFLINPQGVTQDTEIIVVDDDLNSRDSSIGRYEFVLNPFTAVFNIK